MNKVFYGICTSASNAIEKEVIVSDIELTEESFNFNRGDLLVVFFANKNTVEEPHIIISVNDSEHEYSISTDEGHLIKTHNTEADVAGAWGDGETVIFTYTQYGTTNVYYWELVNAVHASSSIYGVTKLFEEPINILDWLEETKTDEDSKVALTPNVLKDFYQLLVVDSEEDDESMLTLNWSATSADPELSIEPLGTLSLIGKNSVQLTYPRVTHTGQLINNGNGSIADDEAAPFITKDFNTNEGLYYLNQQDYARIVLNDDNNKIAIGNTEDSLLTGITINKPLEVQGNTLVNGTLNATNIVATGAITSATSNANTFSEGGQPLAQKYSPILKVGRITDAPGSTNSGAACGHRHLSTAQSSWTGNWKPLGIIGYNMDYNGTNSSDALFANLWECYLMDNGEIEYSFYNTRNTAINVRIYIYVLYQKIL